MAEDETVRRTSTPPTATSLAADLAAIGLAAGDTVLVHTSLSALGWVVGGAEAVVRALLGALGPGGTLVVPSFSTDRTDPARWANPPVPASWWPVIRDEWPPYDPAVAPTRHMGLVVDTVRHWPGAVRSAHPHLSFTAVGPAARDVVEPHPLPYGLGDASPLARLYERDAKVLLLGVGHVNNTSLHLAEYRATWPGKQAYVDGAAMLVGGERRWVTFPEYVADDSDFPAIGAAFGRQVVGPAGAGEARLMSQRALVDFAVGEIERRRTP